MEDNIQRPFKGIHIDSSKQDQPKDSYLFALNAVNETDRGDINKLSNEESNALSTKITPGFIPLGKVYIGDNNTAIWSVSLNEEVSEIGVLDNNGKYIVHVNDEDSKEEDKLNFKITKQIQAVYRLRRGCEKTTYFTDDFNKPRYYNFNAPDKFKNNDGTWNASSFNLQKQYSKIPNFQNIEVADSGGNLEPGSYGIAIQYVDSSLNPTEWITSSPIVDIYNDLSSEEFREINGSINSEDLVYDYPKTSKAIKITLSNLDIDFDFYRLAFVESTNGTGQVNAVRYTDVIPISKNFFIYTGENAKIDGTENELAAFSDIIHKAQSIEQIENRLLLANTEGKQIDFCKLQQYASKIKADCITKKINLTDLIDPSNPKNPTHQFGGRGYMPGEIYSFGIVYIFEDGSLSPAFHIPGKNPNVPSDIIFAPGQDVYPMAGENYISTTYVDNETCGSGDYWGKDSEGKTLTGKPVRHHRFPLRSEMNIPLVTDVIGDEQAIDYYNLVLRIQGELITPVECPPETPNCGTDETNFFEIRVNYKVAGESFSFTELVDPDFYADGSGKVSIDILENSQFHSIDTFTDILIEISDINGDFHALTTTNGNATYNNEHGNYFTGAATFKTSVESFVTTAQDRTYQTEILGIKFSGIDLPPTDIASGNKIIGYYIVRNERTEFDKTILDSAVLTPSTIYENYISHGLLQPETDKVSDSVFGVIHPEHKFNDREYTQYDEIIHQGNFEIRNKKYGKASFNDVFDGSSLNKDKQKDTMDDGSPEDGKPRTDGYDGWSLEILSRDNIVSFDKKSNFVIKRDNIKENFYLDALESRTINDEVNDVFNIAGDNKIGIIQLDEQTSIGNNNLPYVVFKKKNLESYSDFRTLPYYKENVNPRYFNEKAPKNDICSVFNGDSYVAPMRYTNTIFWDNRVAKRAGKTSAWKYIVGAILIVVAVVLAYFTGGTSLALVGAGAALMAAGGGALLISSGIKQDNWNKVYMEEYDKGLRETALDSWVNTFYRYKSGVGNYFPIPWGGQTEHAGKHAKDGPTDDTIQWIGDCITDLWFESSINIGLRIPLVTDLPSYLPAPGKIESGNNKPINLYEHFDIYYATSNQERYPVSSLERYLAQKLLMFNGDRNDNKEYIGLALGELYKLNPDYERFNSQKYFFHLPLEYDCCSNCQENFPHRVHYSEQSFQEELSDNYRIFLPNNYRDIQGESGEITNLFKIGNNLFIHTLEGLWQMPRSYQERITDQVVSFIGTGSYFEIPPQKILDDDTGMSAGLQHKWSSIKTPHSYFFVSENQKTIYGFDGQSLSPISSAGTSNWFKENLELNVDKEYEKVNDRKFPFRDNPSNPYGSGYITTYDSKKERIIFTKRDNNFLEGKSFSFKGEYEITLCNGQPIMFPNFEGIIENYRNRGFVYRGIKNCQMVFSLDTFKEVSNIDYVWVPPVTDTYYKTFYKGFWQTNDPAHPNGGNVVYLNHVTGEQETLTNIWIEDCVAILNKGIVSQYGCYAGCQPQETMETIITPGYYEEVIKINTEPVTEYEYVDGINIEDRIDFDNSWTMSYSLKNKSWTSWHSYMPNFYINVPEKFYSWKSGNDGLWKHNIKNKYQTFYGEYFPHIIEYVSSSYPRTVTTDSVRFYTEAQKYDGATQEYYDDKFTTFNKAVFYNSRQCSGLMTLLSKDTRTEEEDYLSQQVINSSDNIFNIDKNESDWTLNDLRDMRIDYEKPIWNSNKRSFQSEYFIDKKLNDSTIDINKDWTELESFRDKYLVTRFIFDRFADIKLITNYSIENEHESIR